MLSININMDINGRACGAFVQFGCYQRKLKPHPGCCIRIRICDVGCTSKVLSTHIKQLLHISTITCSAACTCAPTYYRLKFNDSTSHNAAGVDATLFKYSAGKSKLVITILTLKPHHK